VLVKNGEIVATAHDTEVTDLDPTAHAEMNLIRKALKDNFKDLAGCVIFSTHEPCPMCTGAIICAKMSEIVYGASIKDTLARGRHMIDLSCGELIEKAPFRPKVTKGMLRKQCLPLYTKKAIKP
jgi:tRNA(adenine34) deaminase